jgi:hypothetical protein
VVCTCGGWQWDFANDRWRNSLLYDGDMQRSWAAHFALQFLPSQAQVFGNVAAVQDMRRVMEKLA